MPGAPIPEGEQTCNQENHLILQQEAPSRTTGPGFDENMQVTNEAGACSYDFTHVMQGDGFIEGPIELNLHLSCNHPRPETPYVPILDAVLHIEGSTTTSFEPTAPRLVECTAPQNGMQLFTIELQPTGAARVPLQRDDTVRLSLSVHHPDATGTVVLVTMEQPWQPGRISWFTAADADLWGTTTAPPEPEPDPQPDPQPEPDSAGQTPGSEVQEPPLDAPVLETQTDGLRLRANFSFAAEPERIWWDLGDGNATDAREVGYTYARPGTYRLNLTIDHDGFTYTQTQVIQVGPTVAATATTAAATATNAKIESADEASDPQPASRITWPLDLPLWTLAPVVASTTTAAASIAWFRPRRGLPFLPAPLLWLFTRVKKDDLLKHPVRAALHGLIQASPGIHFQDLVRLSEKGNGTVAHHLGMMDAAAVIATVRTAGLRCYYIPGDVDRSEVLPLATLRAPNPDLVARHLWRTPDQSVADLMRRTDLSRKATRVALDALIQHGLAVKHPQRPIYRLTSVAQPLLSRP